MPEIKAGQNVMLRGKVKEIIIGEKETLYRIRIYDKNIPNFMANEVLVRPKDIIE